MVVKKIQPKPQHYSTAKYDMLNKYLTSDHI